MHDIICPHCGKAFKIDEAGYADILKQVRDSDFDKQLHERLALAEQDKRNAVELAQARTAGELQKAVALKDGEIQELKARLDSVEVQRKLAVTEALGASEKQWQQAAAAKDVEIQALKARLDAIGVTQQLALAQAVGAVEKERDQLRSGLERAELEKQLAEKSLKDKYETQIKDRDDAISACAT